MAHGQFGIERPPGMMPLNQTPTIPTASSIERTMYWLDQVAIQHDWVNRYSSEDIIWASGFIWKRHNGEELEEFIPKDSGEYNLIGYPINSQGQFENFREIMKFAGDKTLRYYDMYGGNQTVIGGFVNSSGIMWQGNKWITYGAYAGYKLNHSGEASFVDYTDSSHTKYMGRHGKISAPDYKQYIAPSLYVNNKIGKSFYGRRGGGGQANASLIDYNTIAYDFKVTENDYGPVLFNELHSGLLSCSGWQFTLNPETIPILAHVNATAYYSITPIIVFSGIPANTDTYSPNIYHTPPNGLTLSGALTNTPLFSQPANAYSTGMGFSRPQSYIGVQADGLDYVESRLDSSGYLRQITIVDRKDRVLLKNTVNNYQVNLDWQESFGGVVIPLSRKVIDPLDIRNSGDVPHYLRSFTGLTPNDSLDVVSYINRYGFSNIINYNHSRYFASGYNEAINVSGGANNPYPQFFGFTDVHTTLSGLAVYPYEIFTCLASSVDVVYGYVDYSGYYDSNECLSLIGQAVDDGNYTLLGTIDNNNRTAGDSDFLSGFPGLLSPATSVGASGITVSTHCGYYGPDIPRSSIPGFITTQNYTFKIGDLQDLMDLEPEGNVMFICVLNPPSNFENATYPTLYKYSEQLKITQSGDFIFNDYVVYTPTTAQFYMNAGWNLHFSHSTYHWGARINGGIPSFGGHVAKYGEYSNYYYNLVMPGVSSILSEDTSYGAIKSGNKVAHDIGFANLYANTNTYNG